MCEVFDLEENLAQSEWYMSISYYYACCCYFCLDDTLEL